MGNQTQLVGVDSKDVLDDRKDVLYNKALVGVDHKDVLYSSARVGVDHKDALFANNQTQLVGVDSKDVLYNSQRLVGADRKAELSGKVEKGRQLAGVGHEHEPYIMV